MKNNYEFKVFCENIKAIRKQKSLSKKEMAKRLGIGVKSLDSIENGIVPPRLSSAILFKIYYEFGFTPSEIFSNIK